MAVSPSKKPQTSELFTWRQKPDQFNSEVVFFRCLLFAFEFQITPFRWIILSAIHFVIFSNKNVYPAVVFFSISLCMYSKNQIVVKYWMHEHIGCPPSGQSAHLRVQCVLGAKDENMECQFSGGEGAWTSAWGWGISIRYCLQLGVWNQFHWEELDTVSLWTCS